MSVQMNFLDMTNAISSPELADGRLPCGLRDGEMIGPCGPDHVPVNLSARQARERGLTMNATSGPRSNGSFASATLQLSLESRLREKLDVNGSRWPGLIWKRQDMPWGFRSYR